MLTSGDGSFESIREHPDHVSTRLGRSAHGRLVDASRAAGDQRSSDLRDTAPDVFRRHENLGVDVARTDDGKPTGVEQLGITTTVEKRGSRILQPSFEPPGITSVGATDDPDRPRVPMLDGSAQLKAASEKRLKSIGLERRSTLREHRRDIVAQKVRRLSTMFAQTAGEIRVLTR